MKKQEMRAAGTLAAVFSVRLLGLFMIYPVFAAYARQLTGATPYMTGLALGIYGLTQGILQIPFGLLSDRIGRRTMIVLGLLLFAAGSLIAAVSTSIEGVVLGRALQGAGAVGSVILAYVADLTSEENRTKAMALVGITIGASFMLALVAGPLIAGVVGVPGIFWIMVALSFIGIAIVFFAVPAPPRLGIRRDAEAVPSLLGAVLTNGDLLRLDFGVFALHAMLTASFLVVPDLLHRTLGLTSHDQWIVYLPVLLVAAIATIPAIILAERHRRMKPVFVAAVVALAASQFLLVFAGQSGWLTVASVLVFFSGFTIMEATLPSLITKTAPPDAKGTATGIYSSAQFLGIFIGGLGGGLVRQYDGATGVFLMTGAVALLWLLLAGTMNRPSHLTTKLLRIDPQGDVEALAARLRQLPGVAEAVIVAEEKLAYLKVDSRKFDPSSLDLPAQAR